MNPSKNIAVWCTLVALILFQTFTPVFGSICTAGEPSNGCVTCTKEAEYPVDLAQAKNTVKQYYECGVYDAELKKVINQAIQDFEIIPVGDRTTVVMDIDDTVLSNYDIFKKMDFGYMDTIYHDWALEASAPAITHSKKLYDYLVKRGFTIVFLTDGH